MRGPFPPSPVSGLVCLCVSDCQWADMVNSPQIDSVKRHSPPFPCRTLVTDPMNSVYAQWNADTGTFPADSPPRLSCYRPLGSSHGVMSLSFFIQMTTALVSLDKYYATGNSQPFDLTSSSSSSSVRSLSSVQTIAHQESDLVTLNEKPTKEKET